MAEGYEVAANDLRTFAGKLQAHGAQMTGAAVHVDSASLDFVTPLVGLGFKGAYAAHQETVRSAITAIGSAYSTAGTVLTKIADDYEERERQAAAAMTPGHP